MNGAPRFPYETEVSPRCNNLRLKEIKEESTKQTTSVREFTSNNSIATVSPRHICFGPNSTDTSIILGKLLEFAFILDEINT